VREAYLFDAGPARCFQMPESVKLAAPELILLQMAVVKGTKQHEMVVVPHRSWYRNAVYAALCLMAFGAFGWVIFQFGVERGMSTRVEVIEQRDDLALKLRTSIDVVESLRQQVADLSIAGAIDTRANEEVQQTIEGLQTEIAELSEEISFYKSVMLPNVEAKGLRIERLRLRNSAEPNRFKYNLLLTQVVDKHEYIQGDVKINLLGMGEVGDEKSQIIRFRFRYFQNIDGELEVPEGFQPSEVMVVAESAGSNTQRLEKKFDWQLGEG
jgi:hypothetical protein